MARYRRLVRWLFAHGLLFSILAAAESLLAQNVSAVVGGVSATPTSLQLASQFWNPAIVGNLNGTQFESNLSLIGGWLIFDRAGTDPNTQQNYGSTSTVGLAPNFFLSATSDFGSEDFRFSYGTYFPSGALAHFDQDGPQRYHLISGLLIPWHHQATVALRVTPEFSIAVAGIASIAFFETDLAVDLGELMRSVLNTEDIPSEHPALTSRARIPRTWALGFGGAIGAYWRPDPRFSVGASIFSPIRYSFEGELNLETPEISRLVGAALPALGIDQQIRNEITAQSALPAVFNLGFKLQPIGYWSQEYFGRYALSSLEKSLSIKVKSSSITELQRMEVKGQSLNDAWLVGTVQSFQLWQRFTPGLYTSFYKNSARDEYVTLTRIDFDSLMVGGFVKYDIKRKFQIGAEYVHSFLFDRDATETLNESNSRLFKPPSGDGKYRAGVDRVGVAVKYVF